MSYLENNTNVWQNEYPSGNVESHVFRVYGRYLKDQLAQSCLSVPKVLDYGCGEGAALNFFKKQGLDVYGVDISKPAIATCKNKMPDIKERFSIIPPLPKKNDDFFGEKFDLVISMQVLYYLNDTDLAKRLQSLYDQMNTGAYIYVSMVGEQCYWYNNSTAADDGVRLVQFNNSRYKMAPHSLSFIANKEQLIKKFSLFEKLHVGFYDAQYLESEGSEYHYTFIGRKA